MDQIIDGHIAETTGRASKLNGHRSREASTSAVETEPRPGTSSQTVKSDTDAMTGRATRGSPENTISVPIRKSVTRAMSFADATLEGTSVRTSFKGPPHVRQLNSEFLLVGRVETKLVAREHFVANDMLERMFSKETEVNV